MVWCANNGVLISPDFFNFDKSINGMHGYASNGPHTRGLMVVIGKRIKRMEIS
jgi:hypothetical protein